MCVAFTFLFSILLSVVTTMRTGWTLSVPRTDSRQFLEINQDVTYHFYKLNQFNKVPATNS